MSELNTKTLSELTTVDSLLNTDTVLIESGGRMKKANPSVIGGGGSGGGGVLVIESPINETDTQVLNKTWQEIYDAFTNNTVCFVRIGTNILLVSSVGTYIIDSSIVEYRIDLVDFRGSTYSRFTIAGRGDPNAYLSWED